MRTELLGEYLVLARRMSFSAAAKELYLAQPTLSTHMMNLEREIGFQLIDRSEGFKLTEAGMVFLEAARSMLSTLDSALDRCESLSQPAPAVRVGAWTPSAEIGALFRSCTRVPFVLVDRDYHEPLFYSLTSGRADIVFTYDFSRIPSLVEEAKNLGLSFVKGRVCYYSIIMMKSNQLSHKEHLTHEDIRDEEVTVFITPFYEQWISCVKEILGQDLQLRFRLVPLPSLNDLAVIDFGNTIHVTSWGLTEAMMSDRDDVIIVNELDGELLAQDRLLVYHTNEENPNVMAFIDDYLGHLKALDAT